MNYTLCKKFPNELLSNYFEPCISIYMPTHRLIFDNKKDVLVFKNLAKEAIKSLEFKYSNKEIKPIISFLKALEYDVELWNNSQDGLALFATLDDMIIYRVEQPFDPISIVSNSFHIKPLVQYFQAIEEFSLLALDAESFAIYIGNHHEIKALTLPEDSKTTLSEVLGNQHTESYQTHGVYGGASDGSTFHGHGGKSDEIEIDKDKYFRYVDKFVLEEVSKKIKLPLILVANKGHHFDFTHVSTNPYLLENAIEGSFSSFKENELKNKIKLINDQRFNIIVSKVIENYNNHLKTDLSSDQLIIILKALLGSRVDTLMIEAHKLIPGKIDREKQQIVSSKLIDPQTDDLLDDMVQHAFLTGSKVYILEKEQMPTTSGIAAIFRY